MKFTNILAATALAGSSLAWRNVTEFSEDGSILALYRIPDGVADPTTTAVLERRSVPQQPPVCYNNKCLRAMVADPDVAASFCEAYLADVFLAASDIAPFQRSCCSPSKASSACACLGQATQAPTGNPTGTPSQPAAEPTDTVSHSVPGNNNGGSPSNGGGSSATTSAAGGEPQVTTSATATADPTTTNSGGSGDETPVTTSSGSPSMPTENPTCRPSGSSCNNLNFDGCCPDAAGLRACMIINGDISTGFCR